MSTARQREFRQNLRVKPLGICVRGDDATESGRLQSSACSSLGIHSIGGGCVSKKGGIVRSEWIVFAGLAAVVLAVADEAAAGGRRRTSSCCCRCCGASQAAAGAPAAAPAAAANQVPGHDPLGDDVTDATGGARNNTGAPDPLSDDVNTPSTDPPPQTGDLPNWAQATWKQIAMYQQRSRSTLVFDLTRDNLKGGRPLEPHQRSDSEQLLEKIKEEWQLTD